MARGGLVIREEAPGDEAAVFAVETGAFEREDEARLVDALRGAPETVLSLVAATDGRIVGHVLFTAVALRGAGGRVTPGAGLGPVAVEPARQGEGIGALLIRSGLEALRALGFAYCVVLGHPGYYPRFGFVPAARFGITCPWPVPAEAFMVTELIPGALAGRSGTVYYAPVFDGV